MRSDASGARELGSIRFHLACALATAFAVSFALCYPELTDACLCTVFDPILKTVLFLLGDVSTVVSPCPWIRIIHVG